MRVELGPGGSQWGHEMGQERLGYQQESVLSVEMIPETHPPF
tara:strand:- start:51 stop:176 length:126 start_codon:yes stop_codon:yes gene_type:complete